MDSRDKFFGRLGVRCLEFVRSGPAPREDCGFGPREQLSQVTSFLDGSMIYSSNAEHSDSLRIFRNGKHQIKSVNLNQSQLSHHYVNFNRLFSEDSYNTANLSRESLCYLKVNQTIFVDVALYQPIALGLVMLV